MSRPRRRAFTLIELLVVIAIIALLLSILLPSLQRAKDMAAQSRCLVHLRGIAQANVLYASDHDDYIPGELGVAMPPGARDDNDTFWPEEYIDDPDCQTNDWEKMPTKTGWLAHEGYADSADMWICPNDRRPGDFTYSYTINGRTGTKPGHEYLEDPELIRGGRIAPRKYSSFQHTSEFILMGEENTGSLKQGRNIDSDTGIYLINDPRFIFKDRTDGRHLDDESGVSYLDGHAGTIPRGVRLWTDDEYWPVPQISRDD